LAIVLSSVVQLDRIVSAKGKIVPIEGSLVVQPLDKGIIRNIKVAVGAVVKKGEVLATLDPTFTTADLVNLEQKVASLTAETRRLADEEADRRFVPTDDGPYETLQLQIWRERQSEFRAGVNDFDARISKDQADIVGLNQDIDNFSERLKYATEIEKMRQELEKGGHESRLVSLQASDQRAEVARNLAASQNKLAATKQELASLTAQRQVYIQTWHAKNLADLVEKKNKLDEAQQELSKAKRMHDLVNLESPADAVIVKINKDVSSGAVVSPAEPVFTLVPLDAPLEAEVDINAKDIGFVHVGDRVRIKFEAYRFLEHGSGQGTVKTVSQDSFTDEKDHTTTSPYFRARITLTEVNLHDVPADFRLIPGMTLDADIVVGHRTIAWYLVGGALRSGAEAMHEP
jgi:hemolysin D